MASFPSAGTKTPQLPSSFSRLAAAPKSAVQMPLPLAWAYVRSMMQGYTYVNREEDDGVAGLRKAKESYHPVMLEKFTARRRLV